MASITLGRYVPYGSFLHRLDPRVKIFGLIALLVAIFMPQANFSMSFLVEGVIFVFLLTLLFVAHIRFSKLLKSLSSLWFMAIFLLLIYVLAPHSDYTHVAFSINGLDVYYESLLEAGRILLRLILMMMAAMILTSTTKPLDLTSAFEWYLYPLKLIGVPTHVLAMIISLALRFIPTILEDVERIMKAQASRGVNFGRGHIFAKIKAIVSLIIPLFVSAFTRSDELANAMECRGYDPNAKRTKYRKLKFRFYDAFELLLVSLIVAGCISVSVLGFDAFSFFWGLAVL